MNSKMAKELLAKPGVVSVGRGYKKIDGVSTGEPCIIVGVKKKLPLSALKSKDVIPQKVGSSQEITDVVELGDIKLL